MAFEIPADLPNALMPLAWIIGRWEGNGHGQWPGEDDFEFGQQIDFTHNGGDFLHYVSQLYTTNAEGEPEKPLTMETGFWIPRADGQLEVVLSSPEGWSEVWGGTVEGAKIELVTDAVMRTAQATPEYTGGQRLYGQVEGDLLWTFDRATTSEPLQSHLWGRLARVR